MPNKGLDCYWNIIDHMEIWYHRSNKTKFSPSCGNTTVWIYLLDSNEKHGEKVVRELNENGTYCFEQVLEAIPRKTADGHLPPISQRIQEQQDMHATTREVTTDTYTVSRLANTYISRVNTGCSWENQPGANDNRDGWRESERQGSPCRLRNIYIDSLDNNCLTRTDFHLIISQSG